MAKQAGFTDAHIRNLKPKTVKYYEREGRGFTIRVMPSGAKTFLYVYTYQGKRKELNLGAYPEVKLADAREKYQVAHTKLKNGGDPAYVEPAPTPPEHNTFKHFSDLYLAGLKLKYTTEGYKIHKYSLENDVLPLWGDRPVQDIGKRDAIELLERVAKRSPGQVNNVLRAARGVFKYAIARDYREYNPMLGLAEHVPSAKYKPRTRQLSDAEIKHVWPLLPAYLKLILVTAQRPGEVAGMHMQEIQVGVPEQPLCLTCKGCGMWTIPEERTKGSKTHLVYLTASAIGLMGVADKYVFPSPKPDRPIARLAMSKYVARANYFGLPRWTPHDLRRTARTIMARIGIPEEHAEAVIAHCKQGMSKVYNVYDYQEEKKQALIKWEQELLRILS